MKKYKIEIFYRLNNEGNWEQFDVDYIDAESKEEAAILSFDTHLIELEKAEKNGEVTNLFYDREDLTIRYNTICCTDNYSGYKKGDILDNYELDFSR